MAREDARGDAVPPMAEQRSGTDAAEVMEVPAGPSRREPVFNLSSAVTLAILLLAGIHLLRAQFLNEDQDVWLLIEAAFIPLRHTGGFDFEPWAPLTFVTYSLLHGDVVHLVVNLVWLAAFGSPLAARMGGVRFALFWAVTAAAGAALFLVFHPYGEAPLVGASGAVSGMMGAAARFGFQVDRRARPARFLGPAMPVAAVLRSRGTLVFLLVWAAVNLATGLAGAVPGVDAPIAWEAHLGGFLAGFLGLPLLLGGQDAREA